MLNVEYRTSNRFLIAHADAHDKFPNFINMYSEKKDSLRSNQVFSHVGTFSWVVICPHVRGRWDCFPHLRGFGK